MSSQEEKKRRAPPPPISIVRFPQARAVAGGNAFAAQVLGRQANTPPEMSPAHGPQVAEPGTSQARKDGPRRGGSAMTTISQLIEAASGRSPRKLNHSPHKLEGQPTGKSDGQLSTKSASQSSRRSDAQSSTTSRHGSTTMSRHSARSKRSIASSAHPKSILEEREEMDKTARAHIEGKAEKRLLGIMGQATDVPDDYIAPAVRYSAVSESTEATGKKGEGLKSPKKKIFGMSMPSFGKSSTHLHTPAPPMPSKAAAVLGTMRPSTAGQQRHTPRPYRPVPRNDASFKSLPPKVYGHRSPPHRSPPRRGPSHSRTPSKKAQSPTKGRKAQGDSSSMPGSPPTPPKKDTPPDVKARAGVEGEPGEDDASHNHTIPFPDLSTDAQPVPADGGKSPTKFCPVSAEEYIKLIERPRVVSARADMEQAAVELEGDSHQPFFNAFNEADAELQQKYPEWWNEQRKNRFSQPNGELPELPPRFYSPSVFSLSLFDGRRPSQNSDQNRLLFAYANHADADADANPNTADSDSTRSHPSRGSIGIFLQGDTTENDPVSSTAMMVSATAHKLQAASSPAKNDQAAVDTASRVVQELKVRDDGESSLGPQGPQAPNGAGSAQTTLLPDQSSSHLTDILSGFSPSKSGYDQYPFDHCPSAKPRPLGSLHIGIPQPAPPAMGSMGGLHSPPSSMGHASMNPVSPWNGDLPDGSNILTHFYMCNTHMDVLGRTLYDLVENGKRDARVAAKEVADKADATAAMLEQRVEDIKADLNSVGRTAERVSEANLNVNAKLDRLLELIKGEVLERLAQQTKKNVDMENSIKALQNMVQELQKSVDTKVSPTTAEHILTGGVNPFSQLPQHRSQPSLVGFHGAATDGGREGVPRMPTLEETRNEARHRFNNHAGTNNNHGNGGQWYRPGGRDINTENKAFPPSNPGNPYGQQGTGGQFGSPYMDAYGQYHQAAGNPNQFHYSYSNGGPK